MMVVLRAADQIGFDTEADSFYHYQERVCLIQITAGDDDYVVDPLRRFDLAGLGTILADPSKTKVFHDGEYDVMILKRDYGFEFASLFDTRVAAAALGLESPGLAAVVLENFGVELDKKQQRSDWSKRPLTDGQVAYARQDTRYLLPLMEVMRAALEKAGRVRIVEGECRRIEALEPNEKVFNPDEFIRLKGARTLEPAQMQALRELYIWRDGAAEARDVPPFKVLGNHLLIEIAHERPTTMRQLDAVDGLSPKVVRRMGEALLKAVRNADEKGPLAKLPNLPSRDGTGRLDEIQHELHDRLKEWRKKRARDQGIDSSLILNRHAVLRLAVERPIDLAALEGVEGILAWQVEDFGQDLCDLMRAFEEDVTEGRIELTGRRGRRRTRGAG